VASQRSTSPQCSAALALCAAPQLFLVDDAPQQMAFFESHVNATVHVHESVAPTSAHETMLLLNLSHTEATLSRLPNILCQDDGKMPSFIVAASDGHPDTSLWARRRDFICNPHTLHRGRIGTFVQLFRAVSDPDVRLYPMHTNTWFYIEVPGAASSADIKTVSYRYATYRDGGLSEPVQDVAFGSCERPPNRTAVAEYVASSAAGLHHAVAAYADAPDTTSTSLAGEAGGRGIGNLAIYGSGAACLLLIGLRRRRASARVPLL